MRYTACEISQFNDGPDFQHWSNRVKMYQYPVGVLAILTKYEPANKKIKFEGADWKAKALIASFLANECL